MASAILDLPHINGSILARAKQSLWQILPLCPPGYGASPYQGLSAFAGNTYVISPEALVQTGLLQPADLAGADFHAQRAEFDRVVAYKDRLFVRAWQNYSNGAAQDLRGPFESFCTQEAAWLEDFALFMSLKSAHGGKAWNEWPRELVVRDATALAQAKAALREQQGCTNSFNSCSFASGGPAGIREPPAHSDHPISPFSFRRFRRCLYFHPEIFWLDDNRRPTHVAGVPPTSFRRPDKCGEPTL